MRFFCMTITGADDSVKPADLAAISNDFPFVEWGILHSQSRQGKEPRYPTEEWLKQLDTAWHHFPLMNLSAHLCGQHVRDVFDGETKYFGRREGGFFHYARVQLNGFSSFFKDKTVRIPETFRNQDLYDNMIVICQVQNEHAQAAAGALETVFQNVAILYDTSGGEGIPMLSFDTLVPPPTPNVYVGYAGGVSAKNAAFLVKDCKNEWQAHNNHFWMDMETHARSDDGKTFDLKKVVTVLEQVAPLLDFPPKDVPDAK